MSTKHDSDEEFPGMADPDMQDDAWGERSLRDWFAGQALIGWIASMEPQRDPASKADEMGISCYAIADAMLRARGE